MNIRSPFLLILIQSTLVSFLPSYSFAGSASKKVFASKPGEFVVKLKDGQGGKAGSVFAGIANDLGKKLSLKSLVKVKVFKTSEQFATFKLGQVNSKRVVQTLTQDSRVAYAEPNYLYYASELRVPKTPNDSDFAALWGMRNAGQADAAGQVGTPGSDIHVAEVWGEGITGNKNVKVAVIDTGVDYRHPDLQANVDASLGYNFSANTPDALDDHNHGSHCAGTIGAVGDNGVGVAGVNWAVTIVPIKFLSATGSGSLDAAVQAIQWATKQGVKVMSNSWGGGPYTQALYDAINEAKNQGILFVAAAGNDGANNDATPTYPANYALDNILTVAATDNQDKIASFSNYGSHSVHVAAPGVKILSTEKGGLYGVMSGTSMATPHVSGIAALLLSANPSLSYAQLKDAIMRSSDPVRGLSRKVTAGGRVNVHNAIHGIYPVVQKPNESDWKDVSSAVIESLHPYEVSHEYSFPIQVPNAKYIRVVFEKIDTEAGYDSVRMKQGNGDVVEELSGQFANYVSDFLEGDHGEISLKTDSSNNAWGFKATKIQAIY